MEQNKLIAALPKQAGEELRVELCPFKGKHFVGLRIWEHNGERLRPTQKGLTVPLRMAGPLVQAIQAAVAASNGEPSYRDKSEARRVEALAQLALLSGDAG